MSGHLLYCAILANHCAKLVTNFEYYGFVTNFAKWLAKKQKETADTVLCIYSIILKNKTINFLYNRRYSWKLYAAFSIKIAKILTFF